MLIYSQFMMHGLNNIKLLQPGSRKGWGYPKDRSSDLRNFVNLYSNIFGAIVQTVSTLEP